MGQTTNSIPFRRAPVLFSHLYRWMAPDIVSIFPIPTQTVLLKRLLLLTAREPSTLERLARPDADSRRPFRRGQRAATPESTTNGRSAPPSVSSIPNGKPKSIPTATSCRFRHREALLRLRFLTQWA